MRIQDLKVGQKIDHYVLGQLVEGEVIQHMGDRPIKILNNFKSEQSNNSDMVRRSGRMLLDPYCFFRILSRSKLRDYHVPLVAQ